MPANQLFIVLLGGEKPQQRTGTAADLFAWARDAAWSWALCGDRMQSRRDLLDWLSEEAAHQVVLEVLQDNDNIAATFGAGGEGADIKHRGRLVTRWYPGMSYGDLTDLVIEYAISLSECAYDGGEAPQEAAR